MVDKVKLYESLANFIDATASEESELERTSIKEYIDGKSKSILEALAGSKIKLEGDDVLVNGKKVGTVKSDVDNAESGIRFEALDGEEEKEFDSVDDLYEYISERYKIKEASKKLDEEELSEAGDAHKAITTQDAMKSDRAKRWDEVRGKKQPDGKEGEYTSKDLPSEHKDPEKGGSEPADVGGTGEDCVTVSGYDSHDVRKHHN